MSKIGCKSEKPRIENIQSFTFSTLKYLGNRIFCAHQNNQVLNKRDYYYLIKVIVIESSCKVVTTQTHTSSN